MSTAAENASTRESTNGNILLIRLKSIGDILFTLPAVHVVRDNFPGARITYLVSQEHAALMEGFRDVDEVMALDRTRFRRRNPKALITETVALLRRLRRGKFALAVDFQGYGETALLTWLTRARERWGVVYQPARGWAYTRRARRARHVHPVEWSLDLVRQCGLKPGPLRNEFVLPETASAEARRVFAAQGLEADRPALFIQPFTSAAKKNWPLENHLALARHWRQHGVQILFGGGPAERAALEPVRQAGFPVSAGAPLLVTAGLMKLCTLIVGGDTGVLHLGVALGKRVLMIMASAAPGTTSPFQHPDWAVTPPGGRALAGIEVGAVVGASARALAEADPRDATRSCPPHFISSKMRGGRP
jgi:ADP-heptose:LPS heptosyltransferase